MAARETTSRRELPGGKPATRAVPGGSRASAPPGEEADPEVRSSAFDVGRELADELGKRNRRQAGPLAAIAGVYGLGMVGAALTFPATLIPLGVGIAGAAAGCATARRRVAVGGRIHGVVASLAAAGWLALAAVIGPGGWMTWAVWLGGYALAVPYWAARSDPDPDTTAERETPAPPAAPEPPPPPDWRVTRWTNHIGRDNGHLPGSTLTDIADFELGWRAAVKLKRGQHWRSIAEKTDAIASVYDLPDGRVLPEHVEDAPVHRARLTVLTTNPLQQVVRWPGPGLDPSRGTFPIARTADGATLDLRLWWPGAGACHTLLAGTTGSGKSAALDLILSEVAASDRLVPVIIDGNGGMSIPDWLEPAAYTATSYADAAELVSRVERVRQDRAQRFTETGWTDRKGRARAGLKSIDPTPENPGIVLVMDEAPNLLLGQRDPLTKTIATLSQMGRKTAISLVLVTQQPSVTQLGGSSSLRDMLKSGNVIGFRTAERVSAGMVTDVAPPEGLHQLPAQWGDGTPTQGLCYLMTQRLIRSRTWLVDDPYDYAELLPGKRLPELDGTYTDPRPSGGATPPAGRSGLQVVTGGGQPDPDPDTEAQVRAALDRGVPRDAAAVMDHTGLTLGQAKRALSRLN